MKSDLLVNSSHHSMVGDLLPMSDDGGVLQTDRYPGVASPALDEARYSGDMHHLYLVNSLGWLDLKDFRGKKITITSESTMNPPLKRHISTKTSQMCACQVLQFNRGKPWSS